MSGGIAASHLVYKYILSDVALALKQNKTPLSKKRGRREKAPRFQAASAFAVPYRKKHCLKKMTTADRRQAAVAVPHSCPLHFCMSTSR